MRPRRPPGFGDDLEVAVIGGGQAGLAIARPDRDLHLAEVTEPRGKRLVVVIRDDAHDQEIEAAANFGATVGSYADPRAAFLDQEEHLLGSPAPAR